MSRPALLIVSGLLVAVATWAGCKDESESAPAESTDEAATEGADPAPEKDAGKASKEPAFDMQGLQFALAPPWQSRFDDFLQSWVWELRPDPAKPPTARFYVGKMPPGTPRTVDHYASKLMHEPSFQDSGYVYTEVDRKEILDDGWIITGKEKSTLDPKATAQPGFVVYRNLGGRPIRCRGGNLGDPKALELVLAACKAATF